MTESLPDGCFCPAVGEHKAEVILGGLGNVADWVVMMICSGLSGAVLVRRSDDAIAVAVGATATASAGLLHVWH